MTTIYVASTSGGSPTTPITEQRWVNRTNKTTPVLADQFCILDSANSGNEVYSTGTQVISSLNIVTPNGTITAGHLPVYGASNQVKDSGIAVDTSQNLTGLGTLNGRAITNLLLNSNNLSDVSSKTVSFNNVSPLTTKGDLVSFDGTNNVRVPASTNGFVLTADSTQTAGVKWAPAASSGAFVDNVVVCSNHALEIPADPTALPIGTIAQQSPGGSWTLNGDNKGVKCGQTGGYQCIVDIPLQFQGASGGLSNFYIAINSVKFGLTFTIGNPGTTAGDGGVIINVLHVPVIGLLPLNANDVITVVGYSNSVNPPLTYYDPTTSQGIVMSLVRVT